MPMLPNPSHSFHSKDCLQDGSWDITSVTIISFGPCWTMQVDNNDVTWVVGNFDAEGVKISMTVGMGALQGNLECLGSSSLSLLFENTSKVLLSWQRELCPILEVCALSHHLFTH